MVDDRWNYWKAGVSLSRHQSSDVTALAGFSVALVVIMIVVGCVWLFGESDAVDDAPGSVPEYVVYRYLEVGVSGDNYTLSEGGDASFVSSNLSLVLENALDVSGDWLILDFTGGVFEVDWCYLGYDYDVDYHWTFGIDVDRSQVVFDGHGNSTVRIADGNAVSGYVIGGSIWHLEDVADITITGFALDGNRDNVTVVGGYLASVFTWVSVERLTLTDCVFYGWKNVIYADNGGISTGYVISDNVLYCEGWNGLYLHNTPAESVVERNTIYDPAVGVFVNSVWDVVVRDNVIVNASSFGVYLWDGAYDCTVDNNTISVDVGTAWCVDWYIDRDYYPDKPYAHDCTVSNNSLSGAGGGIRVFGADNYLSGNVISVDGIDIEDNGTGTVIE